MAFYYCLPPKICRPSYDHVEPFKNGKRLLDLIINLWFFEWIINQNSTRSRLCNSVETINSRNPVETRLGGNNRVNL